MKSAGVAEGRNARLSWAERLGYGCGDFGFNLYWTTLSSFLAAFYTDVFGLTAAVAGTMLFLTKFVHAFADPVVGALADRTSTRFGKFRPYLLWAGVPLAIAAALTFHTPDLGQVGKLAWAAATYTLMMLLYSLVSTPYSALSGVMTGGSQERTALISTRFVFAFAGAFVVNRLTLPLVERLGHGDETLGYPLTLACYGAVATVSFWIAFLATRERVAPPRAEVTSPLSDVRDLLQSPPWVVLFALALIVMVTITLRGGSSYYYFKYHLGRPELVSSYLGWQAAAYAVGAVATPFLTRFVDKARLLGWAMATVGVLLGAQFLVPRESIVLCFVLNVLASLALGTKSPLTWSMYADCADETEFRTGRRATAMTFAAATFSQKVGGALGSAGMLWLLGSLGYSANQAQSGASLAGIVMLHTLVPGAFALLALLAISRYTLGRAELAIIQQELERRGREGA
jgi:GPH family glycoside/pentoside/hexuronide:cation symporter